MAIFGLIGQNIEYSLSKFIHEKLINDEYQIFSINKKELKNIFQSNFSYLNITTPFKKYAYKISDRKTKDVLESKVSNLIIKKNNLLYAYNTDIYGFYELLKRYHIKVKNKKILILGKGATSKSITVLLKRKKVKSIKYLSRKKNKTNTFLYSELSHVKDVDIIINTTIIGKSKDSDFLLLSSLEGFTNLKTYIDINYPLVHNKQMILMKENGVKTYNGLYMLTSQAIKSVEIYFHKSFKKEIYEKIYLETFLENFNLALIGHPLSGKTTLGKSLSEKLNMPFYDIDSLITFKEKKDIPLIFQNEKEEGFRKIEKEVIKETSKKKGIVISLGGGSFLEKENVKNILSSSFVINLYRNIESLSKEEIKSRPLIHNLSSLETIIKKRKETYEKYSDITINLDENKNLLHLISKVI